MSDVLPGPLLGVGRVAEVFAWGDHQALKLFRDFVPLEDARYEHRVARLVQDTGLPGVPAVGELVRVGERWGIVYERLSGKPMLEQWMRRPWQTGPLARQLADLHAAMHAFPGTGLPDQRERLVWKINAASQLSDTLRQAAFAALAKLPQGDRLCHGDFHPGNVLLVDGRPRMIDWPDATCGHPLADVARTAWLLADSALPPGMPLPWLVQLLRRSFARSYLTRYFELRPGGQEELVAWRPLIAAARLSEGIQAEQETLLQAAGRLKERTA